MEHKEKESTSYVTPLECMIFYTKKAHGIVFLLNLSSIKFHELLRTQELNMHNFSLILL